MVTSAIKMDLCYSDTQTVHLAFHKQTSLVRQLFWSQLSLMQITVGPVLKELPTGPGCSKGR